MARMGMEAAGCGDPALHDALTGFLLQQTVRLNPEFALSFPE